MLMLEWRGRSDMRAYVSLVVGAALLAGCTTGGPSSRLAAERLSGEPSPPHPTRCSAGDPDRWVWFCVISRTLYGIGANLQPETELRPK